MEQSRTARWYAPSEAARILNVSRSAILWYCDTRRLRCARTLEGRRIIPARALRKFVEERRQRQTM